ncbi:protein ORAOV1 [Chaetomidium leptoderma]|uniref:Protein ORAOV1 n=1 Tax=Chaetomidium leptoderma TaxID=669021 RepID=A0AAN6VVH3_9PEZI|nr:protein ORAOV1 [Chaetomidium leptoderma]
MATATATATPPRAPSPSPSPSATATADQDPFDSLLTLEDQFYTKGYNEGTADGLVAGRTEGRLLGLERGFQKFVESGRLQGRAVVWANRLRHSSFSSSSGSKTQASSASSFWSTAAAAAAEAGGSAAVVNGDGVNNGVVDRDSGGGVEEGQQQRAELPPLPENPRLGKHITTLYALVETESLSTENNDEAVHDFDDRLRRAQGRAKVIERMVGENGGGEKQRGSDGHGHDPGAAAGKGEGVVDV